LRIEAIFDVATSSSSLFDQLVEEAQGGGIELSESEVFR
jgi:hypothetical protein